YIAGGFFPISSFLQPLIENFNISTLIFIERFCWWLHILGVLAFMNYLVISKHFHIILAFPNTFYSKLTPKAQLDSPSYVSNEVKAMLDPSFVIAEPYTGKFGAKDVADLSRLQLMNAYTCTECGRCTSACPANQTGKKLSPRKIMMDVRDRMEEVGRNIDKHGMDFNDNKLLLGDYITEEELWACTSCQACVEECPVNIDPLSIIIDLRRNLVMEESKMPTELTGMNTNIENNGAPWQFAASDRFNWAEGMDIPTMADVAAKGEEAEVLFWVGCAGSFDDRYKSVTRSFAKILKQANIKFAVLGTEETCTGDPAKRAGNEFLAQMQAMTNITTLKTYGIKNIVTACPHCFNELKNEYPSLGGNYEVMHHSSYLNKLMADGKLKVNEDSALKNTEITYHDSCYIGRGNNIYEAPRQVLESFKAELKEMKKCRTTGTCCGGGGVQVFKEEENGTKRVNHLRAEQAIETGAKVIAAACPFCMTMMEDGVKAKGADEKVKVKDIAELVAEANGL
ncbi:MAG: heterodisulfide reductase-related iron-sulfur binding cluster, partial [Pseudomonadota bacterium]